MLFIKLCHYFFGYVIIKIVGEYAERLLNQAALQKLYLWDIKRENSNELTAKISIRHFFKLAPLARKTRCRIRIIKRVGLFFAILKLKRRKSFLVGALLFIAAVYFMSSFIWSIEVTCPDEELKLSVIEHLRQWGIKEGIFKYGIDKEYYIDKLLTEYKDLAWAEIEIRGSRFIVELVKKQLPPELEENTPCDIIASKDGIIEEIIALRGEALVKPGQTVSKGDVLITGKVTIGQDVSNEEQNGGNTLLVHAEGIVKARVWYQKAIKVPLVEIKKIPTGNSKKSLVLQFQNHIFNFHLGNIPYTLYEKKILKEINILPKPVGLKLNMVEYVEMETTKEFLGVEKASRKAEAYLLSQLEEISNENDITQKKMEFMLDSDEQSVIGSMIIEVVEDIGQKKQIQ